MIRSTLFFMIVTSIFSVSAWAHKRDSSVYVLNLKEIAQIAMDKNDFSEFYCATLKNCDTVTCGRYGDNTFDCTISHWGDKKGWGYSKEIGHQYFAILKRLYEVQQNGHKY